MSGPGNICTDKPALFGSLIPFVKASGFSWVGRSPTSRLLGTLAKLLDAGEVEGAFAEGWVAGTED